MKIAFWKLVTVCLFIFTFNSLSGQTFDLVWETKEGLKTPESVLYDEARDQLYVSNINGKPTVKDKNGFISILNTDGSIQKLNWITGLNAPKGMGIIDSLLYVTDIDCFHVVDIQRSKIIKTVTVEGAKFLNDIAVNPNGDVYISDMANNHILKYDGLEVEVWLTGEELASPNGLAFFKESLYVGVKNSILKVEPNEKKIKTIIDETGPVDGLIPLGGNKFIVSDWAGRIMIAGTSTKIVLQNTTDQNIQAADLGYIPDKKLVLIPTFYNNKVVARQLP